MLNSHSDEAKEASNIASGTKNDELFAVELHNHLFGAVAPQIIYDAAKRKGDLPENVKSLKDFLPKVTAPAQCEDLLGFISIIWYYLPIIGGDRVALKELAIDFCRQQYENKIFYSESRYTPFEVLGKANTKFSLTYDEVMQTILSGLEEGCAKYGIQIRSILSVLCEWNGDDDQRCIKTLELMEKYKYNSKTNPCGVVGIDIAGNEAARVKNNIIFDKTFQIAKKMGFHCTVHAGEAAGAESVKYAMDNMCAERIGHGYRTVENVDILSFVKAKNKYGAGTDVVHFECCPTSSVCTNAVKQYKRSDKKWFAHPIRTFIKEGVHFSLSTDDPMVFQTDMAEEIDVCRNKLGMSWKQIGQCNIMGAQAAFIDDEKEKKELVDTITRRVNLWVQKQQKITDEIIAVQRERNGKFRNVVIGVTSLVSSYIWYRKFVE